MNKVILMGNLGQDPVLHETTTGSSIAAFSLATKGGKDAEGNEITEWHNIKAFSKQAAFASEHLKKGTKILLEGKLQTSKWQDKTSGENRSRTEIIAWGFEFCEPKQNHSPSQNHAKKDAKEPLNGELYKADEGFEDDIPF